MEDINTKAAVKIKTEVEYVQTLNVQLLDLQDRIKKLQQEEGKSNSYKSSSTKSKQWFNCGNQNNKSLFSNLWRNKGEYKFKKIRYNPLPR